MGAFWAYFRDKLAWPQVFRPGPLSALLEGLARSFDAAREDILWFRRQFSPVTCEDQYLDRHARSRRVRRFPTETDAQYRARVCAAYGWHLLGGKQAGMPQIFEAYGYDVAVASLRPEDEERFAEFRLVIAPGDTVQAQDYPALVTLANEYKRATSKLESIVITPETDFESAVAGAGALVAPLTGLPDWRVELEAGGMAVAGVGAVVSPLIGMPPDMVVRTEYQPSAVAGVAMVISPLNGMME